MEAFEGFEASKAELGAEKATPDVLIYRRMDARVPQEDVEQEELAAEQELKADQFFARYFLGSDGTNKRAFSPYHKLEEFEENLSDHLTDLTLKRIPTLTRDYTPPPINGNPFLGLSHFDFHHNDRFFGRNRAIREVLEKLKAQDAKGHPFVLIYGASGYGKSSLMRAGVAPRLTANAYLDDIPQWRRILITPSLADGNPIDAIARALIHPEPAHPDTPEEAPLIGLSELAGKASSLSHEKLESQQEPATNQSNHYDSLSLARHLSNPDKRPFAIAAIVEALDGLDKMNPDSDSKEERGTCLLLQIDQFEELFTTESSTSTQRENFFSLLSHLVHTKRIWIVATMRSEYFPQIAESPNLLPLVQHGGGYILEAPDDKELLEIIRYPALAARLDFENDPTHNNRNLSDDIYDAARKQPDALPLLEFTLDELYQLQDIEAGDRTLNYDEYETIGRLEGAIAKRAQSTYETLEPHQQDAHQHLFAKLVKVQSSGAGTATKKRAYLDTLQQAHPGAPAFLKAFQQNNLLVTDHEANSYITNNKGRTTVTLAHEALLTQWPLFKNWIEEHRTDLQAETRLQNQTSRWLEVKNNPKEAKARLLSEANLAEALRVKASELFDLDEDTKTYLQASENRAKRKTRFLQSALILFVVLAAGAGYLGHLSNQNAAEAHQQEGKTKEANKQIININKQQEEMLVKASLADHQAGNRAEEFGNKKLALAHYKRALDFNIKNKSVVIRAISSIVFKRDNYKQRSINTFEKNVLFTDLTKNKPYKTVVAHGSSLELLDSNSSKIWDYNIDGLINGLAFSPDGLKIIVIKNKSLLCLSSKSKNILWKKSYNKLITNVSYSPNGQNIAILTSDQTFHFLNNRGKKLWSDPIQVPQYDDVHSGQIYFSPNSSGIAVSYDCVLNYYNDKGPVWRDDYKGNIYDVDFSSDSKMIAVSAMHPLNHQASIVNLYKFTGERLWYKQYSERAENIAFSPDSTFIAVEVADIHTTLEESTIMVINASHNDIFWEHRCVGDITDICISEDCSRIGIGTSEGLIKIFDKSGGKIWENKLNEEILSMNFSAEDSLLWITTQNRLYSFEPWTDEAWRSERFKVIDPKHILGPGDEKRNQNGVALDITFSPDNSSFVAAYNSGKIRLFNVNGKETKLIWKPQSNGIDNKFKNKVIDTTFETVVPIVNYSSNGKYFAVRSAINELSLFNSSGEEIWFQKSGERIAGIQFLPNSLDLIVVFENSIQSYSMTSELLWDKKFESSIVAVNFSPNTSYIATYSEDKELSIYDLKGDILWSKIFKNGMDFISFSNDNQFLAVKKTDGTLQEFNTQGKLLWSYKLADRNYDFVFSPINNQLAVYSKDGTLRLFDNSGDQLWKQQFSKPLVRAFFSQCGNFIITGSSDKTLRVLDNLGVELFRRDFEGSISSIALSSKTTALIVASYDKTLRCYDTHFLNYTYNPMALS